MPKHRGLETTFQLKKTKPRFNWEKVYKKVGIKTHYELAQRLEIKYPNVFAMLKPEWNPKWDTLLDICNKLGIKLTDLVELN